MEMHVLKYRQKQRGEGSMGYRGRFEQPKKAKGNKKKAVIIALCVICALLLAVAGFVIWFFPTPPKPKPIPTVPADPTDITAPTSLTESTEATEPTEIPQLEDIINVLIVGQSARGGEEAALADTMILATINAEKKTVTLTSFLRDTYVDLPDYKGHPCGWNKLTTCYALGYSWGKTAYATDMMNICLKNNFGVDVDYNFEIDFDCFIKLVDILSGVGLEITQAEADYLNADDRFVHGDFQAGWASMDGSAALSYARMRKAEGDHDSDIKRTSRQRKLINALLNNIRNASLTQIRDIVNEIIPMIATNMPTDVMFDILMALVPILPDLIIEQGTCPAEGTYWSEWKDTPDGYLPVLCFDAGQNQQIMRQITEMETKE